MNQAIREGIHLFNTQKFFESHEALEAVWLRSAGDEKVFLHGLIQIAAAFHHHTRGNTEGFRSLLEKGAGKLARFETGGMEIDVAGLLRQLEPWRALLADAANGSETPPPLPRVVIKAAGSHPS